MKGIPTAYSPETAKAFEAFNSALEAIVVERAAIKAEREAIVSDALSGAEKASTLRKRFLSCADRDIDSDIREFALLSNDLPKLDEMARADWKTASLLHAAAENDRRTVLEKHAAELGMTQAQRHGLIAEDRTRRAAEASRKAASLLATKPNVLTDADTQRIAELKTAIAKNYR